jgi:hypothetical protein
VTALEEQETTITKGRQESEVHIWSSDLTAVRRFRKDPRVRQIAGDETWGDFRVPSELWDPFRGFKANRKPMTEEQREQARQNLSKAGK